MRVPMIRSNTVNPYLAARAVFLLIRHGIVPSGALAGERISAVVSSVAFAGLGTGAGRVPPHICALQVHAAIEEVILGALNTRVPGRRLSSGISCFMRIAYAISSAAN